MKNSFFQNTWKHRAHVMMSLPAFLIILLFYYVPMSGLVLAFKNLDYAKGIWNSDWVGFENFRFLFLNGKTFWRCTGNTIKYYIIFTIIGTILNLTLAIAIDQFAHKKLGKLYHSILIIPVFVSYMAVRFIVEAFLSTDKGLIYHQ